ncbi:PLP-dependent aminotransferase family protein [Photobacterium sp. ZSDE20]|uniref:PLP-dependent aminotransferase family protein n=1 Tax=Photobacterium pectinilyticum TaxID=2906793 RepID=A0ABT1N4Y2_9GAMM|nr:PLP-dependent aminotransferase family protein [Photobacterium sp. ZSDE20]MCQ1059796.1 PLP-dependent aminotransferase family protein [Photobacterium sp. ZSDE20]MDD1826147.1 PLP-dependent aminotransferase family protein [Photobacterium sp. ZSDE20]
MKNEHLIHIQFSPERSLQEQIREHLLEKIGNGLFSDKALPSCRKLASMLRVSRNTVVLVYDRLVDEGYLLSHQRSGYYVNPTASQQSVMPDDITPNGSTKPAQFWRKRFKTDVSQQRNIEKPSDWQRYPYPFIFGQPDHSLFPLNHWRECGRLAQRASVIKDWVSDSVDCDDPALIKQLQNNVLSKRGIHAKPEQILITIGTQNSLYLLAKLLTGKETSVGVEDPGYPDARNIFASHGAQIQPLSIDLQGLTVNPALYGCDYVYTTPSHQVPTNVTMSMPRRQALLDAAEEHDFIIIEDDYDSEVNLTAQPQPSLKSLDHHNRVIYVGSLSKSLSPGLRVGFMVADEALITAARQLRRLMYRHPPANNQRTCALFISMGYYDTYLRKLRSHYAEKWQIMRHSLETYLPHCMTNSTLGGSAFWLALPSGISSKELQHHAKQAGILIEAGDVHFASPNQQLQSYVRLGFFAIPEQKIQQGIHKLAEILDALSQQKY